MMKPHRNMRTPYDKGLSRVASPVPMHAERNNDIRYELDCREVQEDAPVLLHPSRSDPINRGGKGKGY